MEPLSLCIVTFASGPHINTAKQNMEQDYLKQLNEVQRQAVTTTEGPVMMIAGPGSGKTRTLTYRIAHLVATGTDAFRVLALTFTNKAAKEMKERIHEIVGPEARNLWMGTFHSVFSRILRVEAENIGYPSNFVIYDTTDSRNLIKTIVKEMNLSTDDYKPNILSSRISLAKNNLINPQAYANNFNLTNQDEAAGRPKMKEIYAAYIKRCKASGAMDFDDLLLKMHEMLETQPELRKKYQERFHYVMVDEYQDTNHLQYRIIKSLAEYYQNICVVGDDAQSIYGFRGANISNILNFQKDYPNAQTFKLEQNYRSTKRIVSAANEIIGNNQKQLEKIIWTDNTQGEKIVLFKSSSDNDEGNRVADSIFASQLRNHHKNSDYAILYRTNAQSRAFEESLRKKNLRYVVYGGVSFYQRKEIKDLLAYMKLIVNPKDEESLRRVINYPTRGIGDKTVLKMKTIAAEQGISLWEVISNIEVYKLGGRITNAVKGFADMIKGFQKQLLTQDAYAVAFSVAKTTKILSNYYNDQTVESLSKYENLQELLNSVKEFAEADVVPTDAEGMPNDNSLGSYLQQIQLHTSLDEGEDEDAIKLMTIHAAKGLEFKNVYIVGMEEDLFPARQSTATREGLEEERRLFYVAATRAEERLFLSYATGRFRHGQFNYTEPSRFLSEISPMDIDMVGTTIRSNPTKGSYGRPGAARSLNRSTGGSYKRNNTAQVEKKRVVRVTAPPPDPNFVASDPNKLEQGMRVKHQRFGDGEIKVIEGNASNRIATIDFEDYGKKKIMMKYAKLQVLD